MPIPRFRIRTLMIAVAVVGILSGLGVLCWRLVSAAWYPADPFDAAEMFGGAPSPPGPPPGRRAQE